MIHVRCGAILPDVFLVADHYFVHDRLAQHARVLLHELPQPQVAQAFGGERERERENAGTQRIT